MKLTKEEKELILKKRIEEEENKPKKVGDLKQDLYAYDIDNRGYGYGCDLCFKRDTENDFWLCNKEQRDKWITEFSNHFKVVLPKGTKFVCYIYGDKEQWFDEIGFGIEEMDEFWAREFLENIKNI